MEERQRKDGTKMGGITDVILKVSLKQMLKLIQVSNYFIHNLDKQQRGSWRQRSLPQS
jgi:hypothetical protein